MAARGRGSASRSSALVAAAAVLLCLLLAAAGAAAGTTYVVGDGSGWSRDVARWLPGKTFRAGDVLVFRYSKVYHDVAIVDGRSYRRCGVPRGARVLRTGHDRVRLRRGTHYFVCAKPNHCAAGMRMAVKVY